jgi:hypothetical protein
MKQSPNKFLQTITVLNVIHMGWKMKKISDTDFHPSKANQKERPEIQ